MGVRGAGSRRSHDTDHAAHGTRRGEQAGRRHRQAVIASVHCTDVVNRPQAADNARMVRCVSLLGLIVVGLLTSSRVSAQTTPPPPTGDPPPATGYPPPGVYAPPTW